MRLTNREKERYSRNLIIPEWGGEAGQIKLKGSTVLVVGAGGSGSPLLFYLASAGVGKIVLCDGDRVGLTDLNRQILHNESRLGKNKALSAKKTLEGLNSDIKIVAYPEYLTEKNIKKFTAKCDLICCAADERRNREAMKLLNRFSFETKAPIMWAGGFNTGGFISLIQPPKTVCMECILDVGDKTMEAMKAGTMEKPDEVAFQVEGVNPIVGAAAGVAGAMQAMEAIKYLLDLEPKLLNVMTIVNMGKGGLSLKHYDVSSFRRRECPYCGGRLSG